MITSSCFKLIITIHSTLNDLRRITAVSYGLVHDWCLTLFKADCGQLL